MVQAIGFGGFGGGGGSFGAGGSTGILEARLNRYQVQLADWCNCPSGKTPEGKKIIEGLQQKADAVQERLDRIDAARSQRQGGATFGVPVAATAGVVGAGNPDIAAGASPGGGLPARLGAFVDVLA